MPELDSPDATELLERARAGDRQAREDLIGRYRPFILKSASRASRRYLQEGVDDEYAIALQAFNEAIDHYAADHGTAFLTFSGTVIHRRLIDYFRQQGRHREIPMSELEREDEEGEPYSPLDDAAAEQAFLEEREEEARRDEIAAFSQVLQEYGLSFPDLVRASPRHQDARQTAQNVARRLVSDSELMARLKRDRKLPLKELSEMAQVSRKTLERQRTYIVALALLLSHDFPILREYVP
jgi:RNA polymerase sigma factor